ncbi:preprotein translocase subunit SecD [Halonotius roseus]|uniref:preprotein translocase subunit SecD n=1 Tax=Halonotius roseus TaxID=2511997 RepID=UPI002482395F|nr:preprotein translocase subunit SecD [Halonotius roseus]
MIEKLKSNWRLTLLAVILLVSLFVVFSPTMAPQTNVGGENATTGDRLTNLQYGLDLAGGTRIRAPLIGMTAENVDIGNESTTNVAAAVANELPDSDTTDVSVRRGTLNGPTVEVVDPDVSESQFGDALDAAGYSYESIRDGLTQETRDEAINVIEGKVNQAGLSGASVQQVTDGTGFFMLIEVPGQDRSNVIDLIEQRGNVRIDIYHQNDAGEYVTERAVLTQNDFASISNARQPSSQNPNPRVPVSIRQDEGIAEEFQSAVVETGVAQQGGATCRYEENPQNTDPCLQLVVDGEVINSFGMNSDLANSMRSGEWAQSPSFVLTTTSFEEAQEIAINLRAGALPAPLAIDQGTTSFVSPTQGENFRTDSLIIGLLAILTVSGVVFARYREPQVALPMILTAFSEVLILLGFAAYLGYPLDLSVIASFIAVLGTGVDDLVIIADGVMAEGDVSSRRVFSSRFKKAFWVIGVAAATTIIAMSPLAVLSLGDLRGFAIFTILGVLVGVFVTRPAYGDILRNLLTER